jgi:hypothetical protein
MGFKVYAERTVNWATQSNEFRASSHITSISGLNKLYGDKSCRALVVDNVIRRILATKMPLPDAKQLDIGLFNESVFTASDILSKYLDNGCNVDVKTAKRYGKNKYGLDGLDVSRVYAFAMYGLVRFGKPALDAHLKTSLLRHFFEENASFKGEKRDRFDNINTYIVFFMLHEYDMVKEALDYVNSDMFFKDEGKKMLETQAIIYYLTREEYVTQKTRDKGDFAPHLSSEEITARHEQALALAKTLKTRSPQNIQDWSVDREPEILLVLIRMAKRGMRRQALETYEILKQTPDCPAIILESAKDNLQRHFGKGILSQLPV